MILSEGWESGQSFINKTFLVDIIYMKLGENRDLEQGIEYATASTYMDQF